MYLFQRILRHIRGWFGGKSPANNFALDVRTLRQLRVVAEREQRTAEEIANSILEDALRGNYSDEVMYARWRLLTPREQQITMLICLNYTTRQIAIRLNISPETVKSHAANITHKLELPDRHHLRQLFSAWDFSPWDTQELSTGDDSPDEKPQSG